MLLKLYDSKSDWRALDASSVCKSSLVMSGVWWRWWWCGGGGGRYPYCSSAGSPRPESPRGPCGRVTFASSFIAGIDSTAAPFCAAVVAPVVFPVVAPGPFCPPVSSIACVESRLWCCGCECCCDDPGHGCGGITDGVDGGNVSCDPSTCCGCGRCCGALLRLPRNVLCTSYPSLR